MSIEGTTLGNDMTGHDLDGTGVLVKERLGLGGISVEVHGVLLAGGEVEVCGLQATCATKGADVSVGSRYLTGVNVVNWPMGRMLMSYFASAYVRLITGMQVRDATAGFVCYRREVLQSINLDAIEFKGYAFQIEMKFTAHRMGFIIKEVPIVFINRVLGTSKMNSSIFFEALWGVIKLRLDSLFNKKRFTRVSLPKQLTQ